MDKQTQIAAAIARMEAGVREGRVLRLVAWQTLNEAAHSLRVTSKMRPMFITRLDALWPDVEAVTARKQSEVRSFA